MQKRLLSFTVLFAILARPAAGLASDVAVEPGDYDKSRAADPNRSPFEIDLALDLSLTIGTITLFVLPRLLVDEFIEPACGLACNPDDVNFIDRKVIGKHSGICNLISDIGVGTSLALPFILGAIDTLVSDPVDGWTGYGKDSLVLAETLSFTFSATNIIKFIVQRPRPLVYDSGIDDAKRLSGNSALSFPSGHTASTFAMATAYSNIFMKRHPDSPLVVPVWIGTYSLAAAIGVMRTEAGEHFYTDIFAGAVLGVGLGLLIPYLHERQTRAVADPVAAAIGIRFTPLVTPGGGGLAVTLTHY
ncbi:MAG: phosphatase PAP2 family protein [Deltaproteobacteria bacterium]|nr:phosphatase PAP2 family protein [Deltaproteobacteria bacterium]